MLLDEFMIPNALNKGRHVNFDRQARDLASLDIESGEIGMIVSGNWSYNRGLAKGTACDRVIQGTTSETVS
ncbi:hypothetical protein ACLOJK_023649 [Asimina triloba]